MISNCFELFIFSNNLGLSEAVWRSENFLKFFSGVNVKSNSFRCFKLFIWKSRSFTKLQMFLFVFKVISRFYKRMSQKFFLFENLKKLFFRLFVLKKGISNVRMRFLVPLSSFQVISFTSVSGASNKLTWPFFLHFAQPLWQNG